MDWLVKAVKLWDKLLVDAEIARALLLKELDGAKNELRKAQDEIGIAKDMAKDLKLERIRKDIEAQLG